MGWIGDRVSRHRGALVEITAALNDSVVNAEFSIRGRFDSSAFPTQKKHRENGQQKIYKD